MTNSTVATQRLTAVAGASRRSYRDRQMNAAVSGAFLRANATWSNSAVAAPKPCTHVETKTFGGAIATLHPRPEEAPL